MAVPAKGKDTLRVDIPIKLKEDLQIRAIKARMTTNRYVESLIILALEHEDKKEEDLTNEVGTL